MQATNRQQDLVEMSGVEKAAALLLFMGKDTAAKLADFFSHEEIDGLINNAGGLQSLDSEKIDDLISEFCENYLKMGMLAETDKLSEFFKEKSKSEEHDGNAGTIVGDNLVPKSNDEPTPEQVLEFMEDEPDHIAVFLLSTLENEVVADAFSSMDAEKRKRMFKLYMDRVPMDPDFEAVMQADLYSLIAERNQDDGSQQRINAAAGVMNLLPEETGEELMAFIGSGDPETAAALKKSLFRFSEISGLPRETVSIIFDSVDPDSIVNALRGSDDKLREVVLDVLSQRNRRMIESELARGDVDPKISETAQREIASIALRLSKDGKISLETSK